MTPDSTEVAGALVAHFGTGKAVGDAAADTLTQSGMSVGTPAYMSPEQPFTGTTAQAAMSSAWI